MLSVLTVYALFVFHLLGKVRQCQQDALPGSAHDSILMSSIAISPRTSNVRTDWNLTCSEKKNKLYFENISNNNNDDKSATFMLEI